MKFKKDKKQVSKKKNRDGKGQKDNKKASTDFIEKRKCFSSHKVGHLKKDYPEKKATRQKTSLQM